MNKLLLATGNQGKIREIKALLNGLEVEIIIPDDLGMDLSVVEGGNTYVENAARKAIAYAKIAQLLTLADDSGLEVESLGGAPGPFSARYAQKSHATDADRREYLLYNLRKIARPWVAKFQCSLALATADGEIHFSNGTCSGEIIPEECGEGGFGYDPIFLVNGIGKTMAELSMVEKNRISHRAKAVKAILPILQTYL